MEKINCFRCSKCGTLYEDSEKGEEMCNKCEESHVGIKELTGSVVFDKESKYRNNHPTEIEVEMEDGCKVWYRK